MVGRLAVGRQPASMLHLRGQRLLEGEKDTVQEPSASIATRSSVYVAQRTGTFTAWGAATSGVCIVQGEQLSLVIVGFNIHPKSDDTKPHLSTTHQLSGRLHGMDAMADGVVLWSGFRPAFPEKV